MCNKEKLKICTKKRLYKFFKLCWSILVYIGIVPTPYLFDECEEQGFQLNIHKLINQYK